jgi:hypothetical protein
MRTVKQFPGSHGPDGFRPGDWAFSVGQLPMEQKVVQDQPRRLPAM